jgi:hypothetical protein
MPPAGSGPRGDHVNVYRGAFSFPKPRPQFQFTVVLEQCRQCPFRSRDGSNPRYASPSPEPRRFRRRWGSCVHHPPLNSLSDAPEGWNESH